MTSDAMYSGNSPNAHLIITIIIIFCSLNKVE